MKRKGECEILFEVKEKLFTTLWEGELYLHVSKILFVDLTNQNLLSFFIKV